MSSMTRTVVPFSRAPLCLTKQRPQAAPLGLTTLSFKNQHSTEARKAAVVAPTTTPGFDVDGLPLTYEPPKTGFLSKLPASWVPYGELARMDKPAGTYYLWLPCVWSLLMAAPMATPIASPSSIIGFSALFAAGSFVMRGAGCAINDLWDRNFDPHVARTKFRPIARGALTPFKGVMFTGAQMLTGLVVLLQFPSACFWYAVPSLAFVTLYPLAKRVTYYPQFMLGLTFGWGAIMGFPALGIDLLSNQAALAASGFLYASNVVWTVFYDMVYAHMDLKDDKKAGVKSIVVKHAKHTKKIMAALATIQVGLLTASGIAAGSGPAFFTIGVGGAAATLGLMIKRVRLNDVKNCWWWFSNCCWFTGGAIATGFGVDYVIKLKESEERVLDKE